MLAKAIPGEVGSGSRRENASNKNWTLGSDAIRTEAPGIAYLLL
jgi:hypothetical protein